MLTQFVIMPISAVCPQCGFSREVRDSLNGRQATCPKCNAVFVIGDAAALAAKVLPSAPAPAQTQTPIPVQKSAPVPPPLPKQSVAGAVSAPKNIPKIPNPLEPSGGTLSLCPTLQTAEELDQFRTKLLTPLKKPLKAKKMTFGYKFGLVLTAMFMILLPIIYVAMIAGLGFFEYAYFSLTFDEFFQSSKNPKAGAIVVYFSIPAAVGAVIIVLLKPLIFGWGGKDTRFEITREREPLLFDFVLNLCAYVGAPMPKRVFVNCDVNAYAGMSHGIWGAIFGGNACDLMIGLPLVAGMKTSEFAGVLAHEFGHFTQAGTRRINYIVRTILGWFAHIYYYRDRMDGWLIEGSGWGYFGLPCLVIRFFIWIARRFIWILMMLGQCAAGFMSRQMEYDADSFEIRLGGSAVFAAISKRIIMLSIANDKTVGDINYMLNEDRLPDNYPLLIAANMKILSEKLDQWAEKIIRKGKTGFSDTHPCDADRIAAAHVMAEPGVLHVDLPASLFFRNFLALSREVSLDFYKNEIGLNLEPGMLKNAGAVIDQLQRENLGNEAVIKFFQRTYVQRRFLPLAAIEPSRDARYSGSRLRQARDRQAGFAVDALDAVKAFEKAELKVELAFCFQELLRFNIKADMSKVEFSFRSHSEAVRGTQLFEAQLSAQAARLWGRDNAAAERLFCARELLKQPEIQNRIEGGAALHQRMETLFPILEKIGKTQGEFDDARRNLVTAKSWVEMLSSLPQDKASSLWRSIEENADLVRRAAKNYRTIFSGTPYPFEHAKRETTLGTFLVPEWNETEWGPINYYQAFDLLVGRLLTTYFLALGECLAMAIAVEQVLGLPPLPVPPPDEDDD